METEQSSVNQNLIGTQTQPQQSNSGNNKSFVVVVASVLLTAIIIGSAVYFWQESVNEKAIDSLEQKIVFLETQVAMVKNTEITPSEVATSSPSQTEAPKISTDKSKIIIPEDWKTYSKNFAGAYFSFRYPKTNDIWDLDKSSGEIYVIKEGGPNWPADVVIDNMLHVWLQFEPYSSGSRRVWLKNNLSKIYGGQDFSSLGFEEVSFPNGKNYLRVYNWPKTSEFENGTFFQGDFYFGVQNGKVVYISDKKALPKETVKKILYSLEIK